MTEDELREILKKECEESKQAEWAKRYGYSKSYVNDLVQGRRGISQDVAEKLGYRKTTVYEEI